jgi:hypothetical protein
MIWVGVGLNVLASLLHAYEQNNNNISAKLLEDINLIKNNKYVDEGIIVNTDNKHNDNSNNSSSSPADN